MDIDKLHNLTCAVILENMETTSSTKQLEFKFKQLIEVNDEAVNLAYLLDRSAEIGMMNVAYLAFRKYMNSYSHQIDANPEVLEFIRKYAPVLT